MSWKKHSSRSVYENDWMQVFEDEVINPGGGRNLYGHVHFKNLAVAIVALDSDDNTWLVGQSRYTLGEFSWELPMGGAPLAEPPLSAAKRELAEETGLVANSIVKLGKLFQAYGYANQSVHIFLALDLTAGEPSLEAEEEGLITQTFTRDQCNSMMMDGRMTDLASVAALHLFDRHMQQKS